MIIKNHFCVFDVETGGFSPEKNSLLSITMQFLDQQLNKEDKYSVLIKPRVGTTVSPEALKANGLDLNVIARDGVDIKVAMFDIKNLLIKYSKNTGRGGGVIFVGHNVMFDLGFLWTNYSLFFDDIDKYTEKVPIDTMWLSRFSWGYDDSMNDFKLGTCCSRIGHEIVDAHTSDADVEGTVELFVRHINSLRGSASVEVSGSINKTSRKRIFRF